MVSIIIILLINVNFYIITFWIVGLHVLWTKATKEQKIRGQEQISANFLMLCISFLVTERMMFCFAFRWFCSYFSIITEYCIIKPSFTHLLANEGKFLVFQMTCCLGNILACTVIELIMLAVREIMFNIWVWIICSFWHFVILGNKFTQNSVL